MPAYRNSTSGSITASAGAVTLAYRNFANGAAGVQVTGTFTGTIELQTTLDGTNYVAIQGINVNSGTATASITAVGIYRFELVGSLSVRAYASAWTSGTAVVTLVGLEG